MYLGSDTVAVLRCEQTKYFIGVTSYNIHYVKNVFHNLKLTELKQFIIHNTFNYVYKIWISFIQQQDGLHGKLSWCVFYTAQVPLLSYFYK